MNLHEYQGKEILASFGVNVQRGIVADSPKKAVEAAQSLTESTGTAWHVIKAQIHAGGRGKGGGVKLAKTLDEVKSIAQEIIGMQSTRYSLLRMYTIRVNLKPVKSICRYYSIVLQGKI